jgi:hypothetical protein
VSPRPRASLDGRWRFWPELDGSLTADPRADRFVDADARSDALGGPRAVEVPGAWQAQFDDLRLWSGTAWYERDVVVPESWRGRAVRIAFGAIDYFCVVWVNGRAAGSHEGGYLPFDLDVTELVRFGHASTITVRVHDPGPGALLAPFPFAEIPHGKQSWYGPLGGIWQSAHLEASSPVFVRRAHVYGDARSGRARVRVQLGAPASGGERLVYRVGSPSGTDVFEAWGAPLEPDATGDDVEVPVGEPELWDIDAPRLYSLEARITNPDAGTDDAWSDTFGFRRVATRDGLIEVNDRPVYLRGALDQDYYLGTICTPPSTEVLRDQMLRAKEAGLNLLRCHVKIPDPRYLYWADHLGLLLWCELPNHWKLTDASKERARATFEGMVARDFNHPSIVIWTIMNESWGIDLTDAQQRAWLKETVAWAKELDPTRLVVDNSACQPNFHLRSDINDFHLYRAIPDQHQEWSQWTASWMAEPHRTYSPYGDATPWRGEPMVLSELGNWGLPHPGALVDDDGREPWWFDTGDEEAGDLVEGIQEQLHEGIVRPRGVGERWRAWGLEEVFGSWLGFVRESQEHQFEALCFQLADLRLREPLAGYVITQLTDCHWECNGLLDMRRRPKACHRRLREANAPLVVMLQPGGRRHRSGEDVAVEVLVSNSSDESFDDATLRWRVASLGLEGGSRAAVAPRAVGHRLAVVGFTAPPLERPARARVEVVLRDRFGNPLNRATVDVMLFPDEPAPRDPAVRVARRWDDDVAAHVARGGRAAIVATDPGALPRDATLEVVEREGTRWKGDWAQGLTWLRPRLCDGLPVLPRIDLAWAGLTPPRVVRGYAPSQRDDVLAGMFLGWLHSTVAIAGAFRHRDGAAVVTTLPVLGGDDPLAEWMLGRITIVAGAPQLAPATVL